ncbi:MAG: zinc-ribbon domain-containing protein [Clostridia bacterium]|nr:zinc-ribbon domain-containing protein [Clostridia bacterium]
MKYCSYCGSKIEDGAAFCSGCGAKASPSASSFEASFGSEGARPGDTRDFTESTGVLILSLFIPIVGLIFYLIWNESHPGKANSALKGLLISICLGVPLLGIILYFVWKEEKPDFAKISLVSGIISFIIPIVVFVLYFAMIIAMVFASV